MRPENPSLKVRLARSEADLRSAERLRYRVFVEELGAEGDLVDHEQRLERDEFDPHVETLVLVDEKRQEAGLDHVVGVYRLLSQAKARNLGRFYCDAEYDLTQLHASGRPLLEFGRSCMDADYRGGPGLFLLWNGLADFVLKSGAEILFGVASFHGTDPEALAQPLSWLHHNHLAPPEIRPVARPEGFQRLDILPPEALDRQAAMASLPPLLKAYLRLGGTVGEGAFIDRPFNTTDVLLLVDIKTMSAKHRRIYTKEAAPA